MMFRIRHFINVRKRPFYFFEFFSFGYWYYFNAMTIFVPESWSYWQNYMYNVAVESKKVTLKEMQSLAGSFAVKALPAGRVFWTRIYGSLAGVKQFFFHFVTITKEIKLDLLMWAQFLCEFNGRTQFPNIVKREDDAIYFYYDISGFHGCGVVFRRH